MTPYDQRASCLGNAASVLRKRKGELAKLITLEMGKIIWESDAEIEKCALACEFYSDHAEELLRDEILVSDARRSFVTFQPLGVILGVMPWNFPFWQVFRFLAPTLMAGNTVLLKHASNVPGCALAIEEVIAEAGFPVDVFRTLIIPSSLVESVIAHPLVAGVSLTGSELAGSMVASQAGKHIKKSLLELGGSDPFIVLEDADPEGAVQTAVRSRMINQGQSCIAAKRFIVVKEILPVFERLLSDAFKALKAGDPTDPSTDVGPMARKDLVEELDRQVSGSIRLGARLVLGGKVMDRPGNFYEPTILTDVIKGMPAYEEETFGPLAAIITAKDEEDAIRIANDSKFGLGGSVWTKDSARGERIARQVETGAMFVNGLVKSDPRLPFGGIKNSGYGRELSGYGIKEFVNIKTIWVK
jgi:succinate-semialdehyde dehydrogenase/glutarate-semialdehyde dehydrogenase